MGTNSSKDSYKPKRRLTSISITRTSIVHPNRGRACTVDQQLSTGQDLDNVGRRLSYFGLLQHGYPDLVNLIIRPIRQEYTMDTLGPKEFTYSGKQFIREDFEVLNAQGYTLQCSHWQARETEKRPCLIYLHGNSSCRVEAIPLIRIGLSLGMSVLAFDFAGCGHSEGEYVSLGYYERDDLQCVIQHLRDREKATTIALWGRSMGAATALMHADRDPSIAALVLDSAFSDLHQLIIELIKEGRASGMAIPLFIVPLALKCIRTSIIKKAHFDIQDIKPIDHASKSFIPALFVAAEGDTFIAPHHSGDIHAAYAGEKNFVTVAGDHNSLRSQFLYDSASIFLDRALRIDEKHKLPESTEPYYTKHPPWHMFPVHSDNITLSHSSSLRELNSRFGKVSKVNVEDA